MPEDLDFQDTPEVEDAPESQSTADDSTAGDEDFLVVDDRTKYRTREDALKGFQEAGKRIASLSAWERNLAARYGNATPEQITDWLEDYRKLRIEAESRAAQEAERKSKESGKTTSDEELDPEEEKALKWLQKRLPQLGYVPKDDLLKVQEQLKEMQNKLGTLESGASQSQASFEAATVSSGQEHLANLLKDNGFPPAAQAKFERYMRGELNSNEELRHRFFEGEHKQVVDELFKELTEFMGIKPSNSSTDYATNKNATTRRTPNPLPKQQSSMRSNDGNQAPKKKELINPATHDKAFALASKIWGGKGGDGE